MEETLLIGGKEEFYHEPHEITRKEEED